MEAHARHTDPSTSHDAATAVTPHLSYHQHRVLRFARDHADGVTDLDMEIDLCEFGSTLRSRRHELVELGMIVDVGTVRRLEGDARRRIVWAITDKGRQGI